MATEIVRAPSTLRLAMPVSTPTGAELGEVGDAELGERRAGSASSGPGSTSCAESSADHSVALVVGDWRRRWRRPGSRCRGRRRRRSPPAAGRGRAPCTACGTRPTPGSDITCLAPSSWACLLTPPRHRSCDPAITTCPGALKLATQTSSSARSAGDLDLIVVEPEHGGHRARLGEAGFVHRRRPLDDEPDAVLEAERAGRRQRRVLAEAVAGAEAGVDAEPLDGVEHHQARHERRQLRVAGVLQLVGVGVEQQLADIAPGDLARLVDQLPALVIDPRTTHAWTLRSLAGERECEHGGEARPNPSRSRALPAGNGGSAATAAASLVAHAPVAQWQRQRPQNPYGLGSSPSRGTGADTSRDRRLRCAWLASKASIQIRPTIGRRRSSRPRRSGGVSRWAAPRATPDDRRSTAVRGRCGAGSTSPGCCRPRCTRSSTGGSRRSSAACSDRTSTLQLAASRVSTDEQLARGRRDRTRRVRRRPAGRRAGRAVRRRDAHGARVRGRDDDRRRVGARCSIASVALRRRPDRRAHRGDRVGERVGPVQRALRIGSQHLWSGLAPDPDRRPVTAVSNSRPARRFDARSLATSWLRGWWNGGCRRTRRGSSRCATSWRDRRAARPFRHDADDQAIRALVSETPGAAFEANDARKHADAMARHRDHIVVDDRRARTQARTNCSTSSPRAADTAVGGRAPSHRSD